MLLQTGKTTTTVTKTRRTLVLTLSPSKMGKKKLKVISKNPEAAAGEAALKRAENTVTSSPVTSSSSIETNVQIDEDDDDEMIPLSRFESQEEWS